MSVHGFIEKLKLKDQKSKYFLSIYEIIEDIGHYWQF